MLIESAQHSYFYLDWCSDGTKGLVQKRMKPKCDIEVKKSKSEVMLLLHFSLKSVERID